MAQPNLRLAPTPTAGPGNWPDAGDAADLLTIVQAQAATMADQADLIDRYQTVLESAQAPSPATATGTSTGTTALTLASVAGVVLIGSTVTGTGVPAGLTIVSQQSGTLGGAGVYITSAVTTLTSIALTITPGGGPSPWPTPRDAPTLSLISQAQVATIRTLSAAMQHYQDILNYSQTPPT
jgi:hypothetical protein